jgi:RNA polymerase sigma factor (sigma-70 family)
VIKLETIETLLESLRKGSDPIVDMYLANIENVQSKYRKYLIWKTYKKKKYAPLRNILESIDSLVDPFCRGLDELQRLEILSAGYDTFDRLHNPGKQFQPKLVRDQIIEVAKNMSQQTQAKESEINRLFNSLMPRIQELVEPYRDNSIGIDYDDLLQTGYETLMLVLRSKKHFRQTTLEREVMREVDIRLKHTLAEELNYQNVHRHNQNVNIIEDDQPDVYTRIHEKERCIAIDQVLSTLTKRERLVIEQRYGLIDGVDRSLDEIGLGFGVTRERVRQISNKSLRKIRHPKRLIHLEYFAPIGYSRTHTIPKQGEIERSVDELMAQINDDVAEITGDSLSEFRSRYNISRDNLAMILQELYPSLVKKSTLALITLCEREREYIPDLSEHLSANYDDLEQVKLTLDHLESRKKTVSRMQENDIRSMLRGTYFPLFVSDRSRCFSILREEVGSSDNPAKLRHLYRETLDHFQKVLNLQVEGVRTRLDDYQKVDVSILNGHNSFVIASEMGTGKSLEAIAFALMKKAKKVLIVSTQSGVYSTWPSELSKHLSGIPSHSILNGNLLRTEGVPDTRWNLITYTTAQMQIDRLASAGFDLVILDECHKMNHDNSLQSRAIKRLDSPYKLAISGSLFKNKRSELFAILNWLSPEKFYSRDRFQAEYTTSDAGLYRLQYELRNRLLCRFKSQVLSLPGVEHVHEQAFLTEPQRKIYEEMEADFAEWYVQQNKESPLSGSIILSKIHTLRKKAIEAKYPLLDEILNQVIEKDGEKAVVYTTYRNVVSKLQEMYEEKYGMCLITGSILGPERVRQLDAFDRDPSRKLFIVTAAGGESIDLSSHNNLIYLNKPLTYADEKQVLDRFDRRGQRNRVQAYHLTTVDSVDERIDRLNARKKTEYERTVHDAFYYPNEIQDDIEHNVRELVAELVKPINTS